MSTTIDQWKYDIAFLQALNTEWNDKLSVHGGRLQLEKGSRSRTAGTPVANDPSIVAAHLESLIGFIARDRFLTLKNSMNGTPQFYERIADFNREVKCFATKTSDLGYTFKSFDINDAQSDRRFSQIYDSANALSEEVKAYKKTLTKPPTDQRPLKHFHYDERTSLKSIKWHHSKRVPLQETVAVAKKALELAQPRQWESAALGAGDWVMANVFGSTPQLTDWYVKSSHHMIAYQIFSKQVLHLPVITEEMATAFEELAPQAELLDLDGTTLASGSSIQELAPFMQEGAIPLSLFLDTVAQSQVTLYEITHWYETANRWYSEYSKQEHHTQEQFLRTYFINRQWTTLPSHATRFISPKVLQRLLDIALRSATCRIALSSKLAELPKVAEFLSKNGYVLIEHELYQTLYMRPQ